MKKQIREHSIVDVMIIGIIVFATLWSAMNLLFRQYTPWQIAIFDVVNLFLVGVLLFVRSYI